MINIVDKQLGISKKFSNHVEAWYFLIWLWLWYTTTSDSATIKKIAHTKTKEDKLLSIYEKTKNSKKVFDSPEDFYSYLNS